MELQFEPKKGKRAGIGFFFFFFFFFKCWFVFCIILAAWPSGKAGDCKSFSPMNKEMGQDLLNLPIIL